MNLKASVPASPRLCVPASGRVGVSGWVCAALIFLASNAAAQVRTFVATFGSDSNDCSRSSPCRTFEAAIEAVNDAGEVMPLDSGGYGPVTITKSVTLIVPTGIHAAIAPMAGAAITVAAASTDTVTLRGLTLNRQGSASAGIAFDGGAMLHVESCEIAGFSHAGLLVLRTGASETVEVTVTRSMFRDNGDGILLRHTGAGSLIKASLDHSRLQNNSLRGMSGERGVRVSAHQVVASGNQAGFSLGSSESGQAEGSLDHCSATSGQIGVHVYMNSSVRLSNCTILYNNQGVRVQQGTAYSVGNNLIEGNDFDVSIGTLTPIDAK